MRTESAHVLRRSVPSRAISCTVLSLNLMSLHFTPFQSEESQLGSIVARFGIKVVRDENSTRIALLFCKFE